MRTTIAILAILAAAATSAQAVTGSVTRLRIPSITDAELEETVLAPGEYIYRSADPKDRRIGDGKTPGGISTWNYAALTNPPPLYSYDLGMQGHSLVWNDLTYNRLSTGADGPLWFLRQNGSNVLTAVSGRDTNHNGIVTIGQSTATNVVITLLHREGDDAPTIEYTTTITNQIWSNATYELTRRSVDLVDCAVSIPTNLADRGLMTFRVATSHYPLELHSRLPVRAPSFAIGDGDPVTEWPETDLTGYATTDSVAAVSGRVDTVEGWGDHASAGYLTAETDPVFLASAAAGIDGDDIADWGSAVGWGDHATAGYLTAETDPAWTAASNLYATTQALAGAVAPLVSTNHTGDVSISGENLTLGGVLVSPGDSVSIVAKHTSGGAATINHGLAELRATTEGSTGVGELWLGNQSSVLTNFGAARIRFNGNLPGIFDFNAQTLSNILSISASGNINSGGSMTANSAGIGTNAPSSGLAVLGPVVATNFGHPAAPNAIIVDADGHLGIGAAPEGAYQMRIDGGMRVGGGISAASGGFSMSGAGSKLTQGIHDYVMLYAASPAQWSEIASGSGIWINMDSNDNETDASIVFGTDDKEDDATALFTINEAGDVCMNVEGSRFYLSGTNSWLYSDGTNLFFSTSVGAGVTNQITSN